MLKSFPKGGVHPPANKLSSKQPIEVLPLPPQVTIPLGQHIGVPATLSVAKGDRVLVGDIIARSSGFVSANIHSSVSGIVASVDPALDTSGYKRPAVTITVQGDEWLPTIDRSQAVVRECNLTPEEIITRVIGAGIVGLGGAAFPSHVKFQVPKGKSVDTLIINGVECEPYLTSDHRLMLERGEEILIGAVITAKALSAKRIYVGVENNKPDAIAHLRSLSNSFGGIEIVPLRVKYPQGGEKQLIKAITNREVPSGRLPLDVGCVVHNVGTALAVYEAVQKGKPLTERVVTVTGKNLARPGNYLTRIGTPISWLVEAAGGLPPDTGKVVSGGPMMGKAITSLDVPVTKGTSGVVFIPASESRRGAELPACIRCANCVSACPMGLEPYLLNRMARKRMFEQMQRERVLDCIECGSCSFVCPANLHLLDYIRLGKAEVNAIIKASKN